MWALLAVCFLCAAAQDVGGGDRTTPASTTAPATPPPPTNPPPTAAPTQAPPTTRPVFMQPGGSAQVGPSREVGCETVSIFSFVLFFSLSLGFPPGCRPGASRRIVKSCLTLKLGRATPTWISVVTRALRLATRISFLARPASIAAPIGAAVCRLMAQDDLYSPQGTHGSYLRRPNSEASHAFLFQHGGPVLPSPNDCRWICCPQRQSLWSGHDNDAGAVVSSTGTFENRVSNFFLLTSFPSSGSYCDRVHAVVLGWDMYGAGAQWSRRMSLVRCGRF